MLPAELHRIVHMPADETGNPKSSPIWRVDSLTHARPACVFYSRQRAESYLVEHGAKYSAETGKWHGGAFPT